MKPNLTISLLAGIIFSGSSAIAQKLLTSPNSIDARVNISGTSFNGVFDDDGEVKAASKAFHGILNAQFSYGLHEKWSLLVNAPLAIYNHFDKSSDDPGGLSEEKNQFHPGDMEAGIRYGIKPEDNFSAAFTFLQSFATSERQESIGLNTGYADFSSNLQFHIRYSNNPKFIFQSYMGFVNRNKNFSDEFHAGVYGWYVPSSRWKLEAFLTGIQPIEEPEGNLNIYQHGLYHNYSGVLNSGGKLFFMADNLQGYIGYTYPIRGQFIYSSSTIQSGIIFKINAGKAKEKVEEKKDDSKSQQ